MNKHVCKKRRETPTFADNEKHLAFVSKPHNLSTNCAFLPVLGVKLVVVPIVRAEEAGSCDQPHGDRSNIPTRLWGFSLPLKRTVPGAVK